MYINKAQLGEEEGISLGWILKAHPEFCIRDDMKDVLCSMMGETFKTYIMRCFQKLLSSNAVNTGERCLPLVSHSRSPIILRADGRELANTCNKKRRHALQQNLHPFREIRGYW
jgi:hypothetical protein